MWWTVSSLNSFILLFFGNKQLTIAINIASYTASAFLVPREYRARVRNFFIYISDVVVDAAPLLNRLAGWWGGLISSVRISLARMILKFSS